MFPLFATGVVDTGGKFADSINGTSGIGCKFAAGVVDTGGKFATGVVDTGGAPWLANISANFRKKFEMTLMPLTEAWGKMIHEKNQKKKISWYCSFKTFISILKHEGFQT